tara:strand:- start:2682 stop:3458 length:777 start_codon:yes stop_codon:yes gene_type:complete
MKLNNIGLVIMLILLSSQIVKAGNTLREDNLVIKQDGFILGGGARLPYRLSAETTLLFDKSISEALATDVTNQINNQLVDIQLVQEFTDIDYAKGSEIFSFNPRISKTFGKDRIFIFHGTGYFPSFFAALRVYDSGEATCFIVLNETLFSLASYSKQKEIMSHEIFHCLRWDHSSLSSQDFENQENVEVLYRLYDVTNQKGMVTVTTKKPGKLYRFIPFKKRKRINSVYTTDSEVKLIPGRYKIKTKGKKTKRRRYRL